MSSNIKLNLEGCGDPIAIIKACDKQTKNTPIIFLGKDCVDGKTELLINSNKYIQLIPNFKKERSVHAVFGQAGSGKSYFCCAYIKEYIKLYPKRPVFLFTSVTSDIGCLSEIKKIKLINLGQSFIDDPELPIEEFKDSLCLFDDIDNVSNKKLKVKLFALLNNCLQVGRKFNIEVLITFHVATAGADTKVILNECNSITVNPRTMGNRSIKYLFDSYLGFDKHQLNKFKNLDARMITVLKSFPKVVISDKEIYIV